MSDESVDSAQPEKPVLTTSQEIPQESKQQEKPPEIKQVNFSESSIKNAGDQGVFFNPIIGISTPDPFVSQDIAQTLPSSAQTITPPTPLPGEESSGVEE